MARTEVGPEHEGAQPHLVLPAGRRAQGVVLALHGGAPRSTVATPSLDPGYLRLVLAARSITARSRGRLAVVLLRNAVRGWNGAMGSPVLDADWALDRLAATYPGLPIGLLGHSLGGRTAFALVHRPEVRSLVALAPWMSDAYDAHDFLGTPTLIVHGKIDTMTNADASQDLVRRIRSLGGDARFESVPGSHPLLWRSGRIHSMARTFLSTTLRAAENRV
ncbi:alpha/beta hydrolase [Allobranchiibius sp. GilTou38]|uniref:dienelactone hydrolase family protein n=1 Tax=Allobranchiibius sp. GilTou38 TaxID=2815210 RepID=UPI001AA1972D|nr:alpha/beta hydrolase [Allobranchiibius sp. GilTou38]MBO1765381.1 alpha/beta hydrolase [Allobranchiibius sp. GilTou38]